MQHKNHGFRMKQSVTTSCLVLHTMKFGTGKVGNMFISARVLLPERNVFKSFTSVLLNVIWNSSMLAIRQKLANEDLR